MSLLNLQIFIAEEDILVSITYNSYSLGAHCNDQNLCLRELSKSVTVHSYLWFLNLSPGSVHKWEHLVSLVNKKFFYAEPKFTLAESGGSRQYIGEDLDGYMKRFHEKVLDCYYPITVNVPMDVYLHGIIEDYQCIPKVCLSHRFCA